MYVSIQLLIFCPLVGFAYLDNSDVDIESESWNVTFEVLISVMGSFLSHVSLTDVRCKS